MLMRALVATTFVFLLSASSFASDPWLYSGRIGGTFIYNSMSDADLEALLDLRVSQNVSILELDSQLSYHLTDQEFAEEVVLTVRLTFFTAGWRSGSHPVKRAPGCRQTQVTKTTLYLVSNNSQPLTSTVSGSMYPFISIPVRSG